jgi:cytochrome c oxidase subunit IV
MNVSDRLLSPAVYVIVFVILVLLTVATVALSFVPTTATWRIFAGQSIAAAKASLVVLFFMHVLRSPAQTRAVIAITVFWFVAVLLSLTLCDYYTRGMIPNLPGH